MVKEKPPLSGFDGWSACTAHRSVPEAGAALAVVAAFDKFAAVKLLERVDILTRKFRRRDAVKDRVFAADLFGEEHPVLMYLIRRREERGVLPNPFLGAEVLKQKRVDRHADEAPSVECDERHKH